MKNLIFAILSGFLLAFGWPTLGFPLLLFFAFVPLLLTEFKIRTSNTTNKKWKIFGLSYLSFFIWNVITTSWLYISTAFGGSFAILANSLLMAGVFMLYHIIAKRSNFKASSAILVSAWIVFEKIHLTWDFSWPWLNLGNGFSNFIHWVQWYEYTGTFGGTLWIWIVNIAIFKMVLLYREHRKNEILVRGGLKIGLLIAVPIAVSYIILNTYSISTKTLEAVILQPNINPYTEKYNTTDTRIGELLQSLSEVAVTDSTQIVVAPETVFADGTMLGNFNDSDAAFYGRQIIKDHPHLDFLSGISFFDRFQDPELVTGQSNLIRPGDWYNDYNSAFFLSNINSAELYHKSKLVVGVENFPYQSLLRPVLGDIMIDLGGTVAMKTTQADREVFRLESGAKAAPIICYESVYGDYVTGYVRNGANFLCIITNDAWWGDTQGHEQHLSYAKLRAVETRRAVVRSANTGISAYINEKGEIMESLAYGSQGTLNVEVTLNEDQTFYVQYGDYIARIAELLAALIFIFAVVKYKRKVKR